MDFISAIADNSLIQLGWLAGFFVMFGILEKLTPCNRGHNPVNREFLTNSIYYFVMPILGRFINTVYTGLGILIFFRGVPDEEIYAAVIYGRGPLAEIPVWAQAAIIFLASDFLLYWTHRLFHTGKLWPIHSIHHSSTEIHWHSTYRFHPLNVWLTFTLVDTIMLFIGFSLEAVTLMATFNMLYSAMVHANLNWTFGPFRYIFASPVFHRWHHTMQDEGMDKNFAPTFPLLDIVFGTFYMPDNRVPESYGIQGANVPESFLGQVIYPFRRRKA
jgi:sterol desaturase/sphingolipid hydroxylase (fatty acid hydroxylase superfamily)